MSLQKKLREAATAAAVEATRIERHRCVWAVDQLLEATKAQLDNKLLSVTALHTTQLRVQLLELVCGQLKLAILSGHRPPSQQKETTDGTSAQNDREP